MAHLAVIEDSEHIQLFIETWAPDFNHDVVARASDRAGALALIQAVHDGEIVPPPDAWIIDGNLQRGVASGDDARAVVSEKQRLEVGGVAVGFSNSPMSEYGIDVDLDLGEKKGDIPGALAALTKFLETRE